MVCGDVLSAVLFADVVGYHHDAEVVVWSLQHEVHGCVLDLTGEFGIGLTSDLVLEGEVFDFLALTSDRPTNLQTASMISDRISFAVVSILVLAVLVQSADSSRRVLEPSSVSAALIWAMVSSIDIMFLLSTASLCLLSSALDRRPSSTNFLSPEVTASLQVS